MRKARTNMILSPSRRMGGALLALLAILSGRLSAAPNDARIGLADFAVIKDVRAALLSPDGRDIACVVAVIELEANRVRTELWLVPTTEGEARQLALDTEAIEKVLWSPRGDRLAVVGSISPRTSPQEA